ncbi:MAG: dihydroorotase, partial [Candidatus Riflebacteria bacterium]|nr:dihydroorotase [Candidatus Riflebacteria bacterium]
MNQLVIANGRLVDRSAGLDRQADLLVEDGRIAAIGRGLQAADSIDATGLAVLPGLFDAHVHLREPGGERKETVASGTYAAARGGVTAVACMPNTQPAIDCRAVVEFVLSRPRRVHVHPIGAITRGRQGRELTDFGDLKAAGAIGLSDDGSGVQSARLMRQAMESARRADLPLIQHCQDDQLAGDGVVHEGALSARLGLAGMPWTAEATMLARDLLLLEQCGGRLHVAHLSCRQSVELVRRAKGRGLPVTAEACPHHFILTDRAIGDLDPCTKVNPPLREQADVDAVLDGIRDGTLDIIASDHAPHTAQEKRLDYTRAPFGISGLETLFALSFTYLVVPGVISLDKLGELLSTRPRALFGLAPVRLEVGSAADLVMVDLDTTFSIDRDSFASLGKNTPFHGFAVRGRVVRTLVGGQIV